MLIAAAEFIIHATNRLRAHDFTAEEANARIAQFSARIRASSTIGLFDQQVVILGQTDQFKGRRMGQARPQTAVLNSDPRPRRVPVEDPPGENAIVCVFVLWPCRE